jgi:hypothetical protein
MICPRCDSDGILDEKVIAAEHAAGLQTQSACSTASNRLSGPDDNLLPTSYANRQQRESQIRRVCNSVQL